MALRSGYTLTTKSLSTVPVLSPRTAVAAMQALDVYKRQDFFFPYEKAKLWTGNMVLLSLSNFLLYASLYMMLPALPLWMVRPWYCSYAEAGAAIAVFGLEMCIRNRFIIYQ